MVELADYAVVVFGVLIGVLWAVSTTRALRLGFQVRQQDAIVAGLRSPTGPRPLWGALFVSLLSAGATWAMFLAWCCWLVSRVS